MEKHQLQERLRCCIHAILDIESAFTLNTNEVDIEFGRLRWFLDNLESLPLQESDVQRLERATERILEEMRIPVLFSSKKEPERPTDRIQ